MNWFSESVTKTSPQPRQRQICWLWPYLVRNPNRFQQLAQAEIHLRQRWIWKIMFLRPASGVFNGQGRQFPIPLIVATVFSFFFFFSMPCAGATQRWEIVVFQSRRPIGRLLLAWATFTGICME